MIFLIAHAHTHKLNLDKDGTEIMSLGRRSGFD